MTLDSEAIHEIAFQRLEPQDQSLSLYRATAYLAAAVACYGPHDSEPVFRTLRQMQQLCEGHDVAWWAIQRAMDELAHAITAAAALKATREVSP